MGWDMAGRREQSAFEDLVEMASKLPWQVGLALAAASYLGLHAVADITVARPADTGGMGIYTIKQFGITFAAIGQMLFPFCFLVGAGWSFFERGKPGAQAGQPPAKNGVPRPGAADTPQPRKEAGPAPRCPKCNKPMVKRRAKKKGAKAGKEFWGCPQYPKCKSVLAIDADLERK